MDAATLPVRCIVRASYGPATDRHRHVTGRHRPATKLHCTGADRHATGTPVGARNPRPRARHRPPRNTTLLAPPGEHLAMGTQADTGENATGAPGGTRCHRRPRRNTVPQAPPAEHNATGTRGQHGRHPGPTWDEHAAGVPGGKRNALLRASLASGTHCHGILADPGRPGPTRDEHATATPRVHVTRARRLVDKRPNCARCVAWSG